MSDEPARPLTPDEQRVLDLLLGNEYPGVEQLRLQAAGATVVGRCDCGCPTIYLAVPEEAARAPLTGRLAPVEGRVAPQDGEPQGDIILFLDDGRLTSMEYVFYTDAPPVGWPPNDRLSVVEAPRR